MCDNGVSWCLHYSFGCCNHCVTCLNLTAFSHSGCDVQTEVVQARVHKSLKVWSLYADLEESFGTFKVRPWIGVGFTLEHLMVMGSCTWWYLT